MDITKVVAKIRLDYYLNMLDVCNVLNQLRILKDTSADSMNKKHLKNCLDCYERLGYKLPKEFRNFKNEM